MKPFARWTNDCQGKKDFDGPIVDISTRYWPRGGGFTAYLNDPETGLQEMPTDSSIKPSASASIRLLWAQESELGDYSDEDLISADFEGETFEDVAAQVEAWAEEQLDKVAAAVRAAFQRKDG